MDVSMRKFGFGDAETIEGGLSPQKTRGVGLLLAEKPLKSMQKKEVKNTIGSRRSSSSVLLLV